MKIIFLDFDGVLNSWAWWARQPERSRDQHTYLLDPAAIGLLNQLVLRTGAHVVISSTWRLNKEMKASETLRACGFTGRILGQTPNGSQPTPGGIYLGRVRGHEIANWLSERKRNDENMEAFVILDDDSDMAHLAPYHVKTSHATGLTQDDVDRAVILLGGPPVKETPS